MTKQALKGILTGVVLKADVWPGFTDMMTSKVDNSNGFLKGSDSHEK